MGPVEFGLVLASAFLHAWWSTSIKASRDPMIFNLLQGGTSIVLAVAVLPQLHYGEIPTAVWQWLAVTAPAHGLYIYWFSRAFEHGDLTLVYPVARSTPAFLPLLAVPFFGEVLTVGGVAGIGIVVAGVWLVHAGASFDWRAFTTPAARFALLTLAATVAYSLADKQAMVALFDAPWSSRVPRALAFYTLLTTAHLPIFAALALRHRTPRQIARETRPLLASATFASLVSLLGYGLILKALETAPASYVVAVRQASVLFALGFGVVTLRERPTPTRVIGAAATVVGVALIAWLGA